MKLKQKLFIITLLAVFLFFIEMIKLKKEHFCGCNIKRKQSQKNKNDENDENDDN